MKRKTRRPVSVIHQLRCSATKLGRFTIGDLRAKGYCPGQIRVFLRLYCKEVGATKGANGKPVSVFELRER